MEKYIVMI